MGPQRDEWGNSVQHVLSHTVRDSAAILDATAHPFPGDGVIAPFPDRPFADYVGSDPGALTIGVLDRSVRDHIPIDPEVAAAVRMAADQLSALGHNLIDGSPPALDDQELILHIQGLQQVVRAMNPDLTGRVGHHLRIVAHAAIRRPNGDVIRRHPQRLEALLHRDPHGTATAPQPHDEGRPKVIVVDLHAQPERIEQDIFFLEKLLVIHIVTLHHHPP